MTNTQIGAAWKQAMGAQTGSRRPKRYVVFKNQRPFADGADLDAYHLVDVAVEHTDRLRTIEPGSEFRVWDSKDQHFLSSEQEEDILQMAQARDEYEALEAGGFPGLPA